MRRISRRSWTLGVVAALAVTTMLPAQLEGQASNRRKLRADGEPDRTKTVKPHRQFTLFGLADAAYSDIKASNRKYYWQTCNFNGSFDCDSWGWSSQAFGAPAYMYTSWAIGTPPSVRDTIIKKVGAPAAGYALAQGGGWNLQFNENADGTDVLLPQDGQLGQYLAGAPSTADKTCRDHTHDLTAGTPLLATSDCPETWGPLGWRGRRPVPEAEYLAAARADPANFKFDFWKMPSSEPDNSGKLDKFFGSFQTYGLMSDYSKEEVCGGGTLRTFGRVAKGLPNYTSCPDIAPTKPGYPIGLEIRFDAYTYGIPALSDVIYYQATVTNRSQDLFGVGVDYDSLYVGPMPAYYSTTQSNPTYMRPDNNTIYSTPNCAHQVVGNLCNGARTVADLSAANVTASAVGGSGGAPWDWGTTAFIILKSPIGDMRNKLFSRPASPFSTLGVPSTILDDTITFSHGHMCGFRACTQQTWVLDYKSNPDQQRRAFGMISSTERNVLGNRTDPGNLGGSVSGQILWHTFRSADWPAAPAVGPAANQFPQTGGFNRWVPPGWDWNNDGISDTLYYDTCSNKGPGDKSTVAGACVGIWSDTMPHSGPDQSTRWRNGYGNVGGVATVGPISLKAGESVGFIFAFTTACCGAGVSDSLAIQAKVDAAIDHYMNFFLGPEPLPKDTIVAVQVVGGNQTVSRVVLTFTETAENSRDPFLGNLAAKYTTAGAGTPDYVLASLNPTLVDSLVSASVPFGKDTAGLTAAGNFDKKYIFKSCDGGNTWTNNANCAPSPAVGGPFAALGWLPYATLERDAATGDLPNSFIDENVNGGTTYTYVLISVSRGANYILSTGDAFTTITVNGQPRNVCTANCATKVVSFAPSLFNALSTSGPNTRAVYVPASNQAGSAKALVTIQTTAGPVEQSAIIVTPASDTPVAGNYTLTFYDSVRVIVRDSMDADMKVRLGTLSTVDAWKGTPSVATRFASVKVGGVGLNGSTIRSAFQSGTIRITEHFFSGTTAVLNGPNGAVLVTNDLSETATPETFFSSAAFPGFTLGFAALTPLALNTTVGEQFVVNGVTTNELTKPFVRLRPGLTTVASGSEGGRYRITWTDKPFGPSEPFRIDPTNPQRTDSAVNASLTARALGSTGVVTPAIATLLGTTAANLVAVKLPFTIYNESFTRPVQVAMRKRSSNVFRFGRAGDTASVAVPEDVWVPGDSLVIIEDLNGATAGGDAITFSKFTLGCDPSIASYTYCNPIALLTPGGTNWITTKKGTVQTVLYNPRLTTAQQFTVSIAPRRMNDLVSGADLKTSIKSVRVVPNPYVAFTNYVNPRDPNNRTRPLLFTHVPPRGRIRIYTVSGQLVQQLTWVPADLNETGDLIWDLRTREGLDVAGGLYMFMVTGQDASGKELASHLGKFVIVR